MKLVALAQQNQGRLVPEQARVAIHGGGINLSAAKMRGLNVPDSVDPSAALSPAAPHPPGPPSPVPSPVAPASQGYVSQSTGGSYQAQHTGSYQAQHTGSYQAQNTGSGYTMQSTGGSSAGEDCMSVVDQPLSICALFGQSFLFNGFGSVLCAAWLWMEGLLAT